MSDTDLPHIYAMVTIDPSDGNEAVIVLELNGVRVPMVCQEANLSMLELEGPRVSQGLDTPVDIVKFTRAEVAFHFGPDQQVERSEQF